MSALPPHHADAAPQAPVVPESSLLGLLNVLLRRRWLVVAPALIALAAVAAIGLTRPRTWTATASFAPHSRQGTANLSGLAAQLGVGIAGGDPLQSPQFYAELVTSRELLQGLAATRFELHTDSGRVAGTLLQLYRPPGPTPALQLDALLRRLEKEVKATPSQQTGVVHVRVTAEHGALAQQMASRLLELVNTFNLQTRQSMAKAEREFTERRLAEATQELRTAENRLQTFLQRNREFGLSPALTFERDRLQREVNTRSSIQSQLLQTLEQVRVEEVRDVPLITVLERPAIPARPDGRGLIRNGIVALIVGTAVGCVLAFTREYFARARRTDEEDYEELAVLGRDALRDVTRPWTPVARLLRRRSGA